MKIYLDLFRSRHSQCTFGDIKKEFALHLIEIVHVYCLNFWRKSESSVSELPREVVGAIRAALRLSCPSGWLSSSSNGLIRATVTCAFWKNERKRVEKAPRNEATLRREAKLARAVNEPAFATNDLTFHRETSQSEIFDAQLCRSFFEPPLLRGCSLKHLDVRGMAGKGR